MPKLGMPSYVSSQVWKWDLSGGIAAATLVQTNFVTAGYTPTPVTGTPLDDAAKGTLKFYAFDDGPNGSPVDIYVDGVPYPGNQGIPLRLYVTADGLEPYLFHTGPNRAVSALRCQVKYEKTGEPPLTDEWVESWS